MKKNQIKLTLCFIFLNVSIYLSVTVSLNFLFLLFNGLIIYMFYGFDKKKSQTKGLIKGKNPINPYDIPASEHPIIQSARNRLRKKS